ncbi:MAG: MerR family transcriptional regulator [Oligoflexia bacterium]|nr:MerR family transcriptional regulator [Oligoflexia bacterium]
MYKIKEFSEITGFSSRMLRHLEDFGLLSPNRNEKNYRSYSYDHIPVAIKIKSFQKMGFSLREIKSIISMDLKQLEGNLTELFKKKEGENKKIESQLRKIQLVQKSIKSGESDFDFIEQLDEIDANDRAQILLGFQDLVNRVVKGRMPRVEIITDEMLTKISDKRGKYDFDSVDLIKFGEWLKLNSSSFYAIYEVEELLCYFLVIISEDELLKNMDLFNIKNINLMDDGLTSSIKSYTLKVIENFRESWKKYFIPLTFNYKGITDDKCKVATLLSSNEVLLSMRFKKIFNNEIIFKFALGLPINVIKAIDSATPYRKDELAI